MGVLSDSLISISNDKRIKIKDLNINDQVLSVKSKEGLLNYKYYGKSIQLSHKNIDLDYNDSYIHYSWNFTAKRYRIINNKLKISFDHIIFIYRNDEYTWDYVKSLKIGDKLLKEDLSLEEITSLEDKKIETQFYSLNLRGFYNYFCEGYLLHNAGYCDQDLSYSIATNNSDNTDIVYPDGSCAYCGIDNKALWFGKNRHDQPGKPLPVPKYLGFNNPDLFGIKDGNGAIRTYLKTPRPWYDRSLLRINDPSVTFGGGGSNLKFYHVYLATDGQWKTTEASYLDGSTINHRGNMPDPEDIFPHDFTSLFDPEDNSEYATRGIHLGNNSASYSHLSCYNGYCKAVIRVLLNDSTNPLDWVPYGWDYDIYQSGISGTTFMDGSMTSDPTPIARYATDTRGYNNELQEYVLGSLLTNWAKVRLCITIYKSSSNLRTNPSTSGTDILISHDGINAYSSSYSRAEARWRFVNARGGSPGAPHPFSTNTNGAGGKNDSDDDYHWGIAWNVISLDNIDEN